MNSLPPNYELLTENDTFRHSEIDEVIKLARRQQKWDVVIQYIGKVFEKYGYTFIVIFSDGINLRILPKVDKLNKSRYTIRFSYPNQSKKNVLNYVVINVLSDLMLDIDSLTVTNLIGLILTLEQKVKCHFAPVEKKSFCQIM